MTKIALINHKIYFKNLMNQIMYSSKIKIIFKRKIFIFIFVLLFAPSKNMVSGESFINRKEESSNEYNPIKWEKINSNRFESPEIKWEKVINGFKDSKNNIDKYKNLYEQKNITNRKVVNALNRSVIINNNIIGPDISWIVPIGFKWNNKYKFDLSTRGYSRRKDNEPLWGWNGGDAVGEIHYQPVHFDNYSLGLNLGIRSVYSGSAPGGSSAVGEGLSSGFRLDKSLNESSGIAIGGEQILHFDNKTDTGRNLYFVASKAWWSDSHNGYPITLATAGLGTGKLAEGNIKGLCSDLLGGSGTEEFHMRSLCWAPIFSVSKIYSNNISTFFEYNSKWFLIGTSYAPLENNPIRGTLGVIISDHIDNYKIHSFDELRWVFRIGVGF